MNLQKIFATIISTVMVISMLIYIPTDTVSIEVSATNTIRREVSLEQPMYIVHIDSWNYADPEKIINLIPKDVLPYCVFNISLSINWDSTNHKCLMVQDGYETAKSWLGTCADMGVWTMIQPSSGGQSHFPDYDSSIDYEDTIYAEFFRDYPNFLGYNYCEQFWGFESQDFPITCEQRYRHFAELLKLCNKYGGYLDVSWCGNQWSPKINPLAMLKQVPEWEDACKQYSDNFILEEKYTQRSYIEDMESLVYGAYVSGYCGNFGVRYDETGWTDLSADNEALASKDQYRVSTGLPIFLERMVQNGATVIDGPELVWADDFKENYPTTTTDGYTQRSWAMYDQYQNVMIDLFRKIQDGTIRIPNREEVIERTKVVIIQDVKSGTSWDDAYSSYPTLFEGLYRMDYDGNLKDNTTLYKSTGRYQTVPTVYALKDDLAKSIPVQIKQSEIPLRWVDIKSKQEELNTLYPLDYWGNCYAGRNENTWVTYNPNKRGELAGGFLSLRYNTCKELEVTYSIYGSGIINEYSDHIDFYLNNYDQKNNSLSTDKFVIYGCNEEPTITYTDRGVNQITSNISTSFEDGNYTIIVEHNGPIDISVNCSGNETDRLTEYKTATLTQPSNPELYTGISQYEGEFFDYKNIEGNVTNGCNSGITNYQGQGFIKFGTKSDASVRETITTTKNGTFNFNLRYSTTFDTNSIDLYINGLKVSELSLSKTSSLSDWNTYTQEIELTEDINTIGLKSSADLSSTLYIDNFTIEKITEPLNITIGDVNIDGKINVLDICMLKRGLIYEFSNENSRLNADTNQDGKISCVDLLILKKYVLGIINEFPVKDTNLEDFMQQVQENLTEIETTDATSELSGVEYGSFETKTFYSNVCKRNKNMNILLPAGYTADKEYPVLYVLHGYWGNENSLLDIGDASLKLRQIIGNAIASNEAKEMIVVFPNIYASATQESCSDLDETNNLAYDNFINVLTKEIMPYMEENYSIKTGRENTAITGFSMGGRESLYIGFSHPELFGYIGAMCPAPGLNTDLITDENLKFTDVSTQPYLLMVSAGSNDQVVWSTPSGYHDILTENNVTHVWHYVSNGDHGGFTIRPHMYNFVRNIF